MAGQIVPESFVDTFVDQNTHLRTGEQKALRFFEGSDRRFARDGGKALQEVFECFAALQVVKQSLDRHSRPAKDRSSSEDIVILDDDIHDRIVPRA
jgi:hypothetical protein